MDDKKNHDKLESLINDLKTGCCRTRETCLICRKHKPKISSHEIIKRYCLITTRSQVGRKRSVDDSRARDPNPIIMKFTNVKFAKISIVQEYIFMEID